MNNSIVAFVIALTAALPNGLRADPYQACSAILEQGTFNTTISSASMHYQSIFRDYLCQQTSRTTSNQSKFDSAASFLGSGFFAEGSGSYSQQEFDDWKRASCQSASRHVTASSSSFDYLQVASPDIVNAWKSCVANENNGLLCWAEPISENRVMFRMQGGNGTQNNISDVQITVLNGVAETSLPVEIEEGVEYPVVVSLTDTTDSTIFVVTGRGDQFSTSCTYVVPPEIQLPELLKFNLEKAQNLTFAYSVEFSMPVTIAEGVMLLGGQSFPISANEQRSRFLAGGVRVPQYPTTFDSATYEAQYWACQSERGCGSGDLSCVNGCREEKARDYADSQGVKNSAMQALYNDPGVVRLSLVDTNGNVYYAEISQQDSLKIDSAGSTASFVHSRIASE